MFKYWTKNRLAADALISLAMSLVFAFGFIFPNNSAVKTIENNNSIYLNTQIDYQLPSPSKTQLGEIQNLQFVDSTFGYYLTKTNVEGSKTSKVNLMMSDCMDKIEFTLFNPKTEIEHIAESANYAYIDEVASKALNAKVGDTISATIAGSKISYTVCGLYKDTKLFKEGAVMVDFFGQTKVAYESAVSAKGYSAAFLKVNNLSACADYLRNYKPEGRLKDRDEFESDEAYETYNNSILSGNYSNEITNFAENRTHAQKELSNSIEKRNLFAYIGAATVAVISIVASLILRFRKSEDKYFAKILKDKKQILSYRLFSVVASSVVFAAVAYALSTAFGFLSVALIPTLVGVAGIVVAECVNIALDSKYKKS